MQLTWDDQRRRLIDETGKAWVFSIIGNAAQFDRWSRLGFDFSEALLRRERLHADLERALGAEQISTLGRYLDAEVEHAQKAGITTADPDFWRIRSSGKHVLP